MTSIFVGLTLAASLSPLFTFAHLFQLKEWRWDRFREHIRSEGLRQVFGMSRPIVVGIMLTWLLVTGYPFGPEGLRASNGWLLTPTTLSILTTLNIVQILLKKQPYPVWTQKAITLVGTSLAIDLVLVLTLTPITYHLTPIIVLLQPLFLTTSWILWKPIDSLLKHRLLARARALRAQFPNLMVIGITGSTGKTTTKELLAHILGPNALATPEHVNTELGVAKWLIRTIGTRNQDLGPSPHVLVVEMGAYREGEIRTLCSIAQPTMGIITNIGTQHIGLFGSQRAIAEAKGELFAALPPSGHAFIHIDIPFAQELRKKCRCPVTTVGTEGTSADVRATHVEETPEGLRFHIHTTSFSIPLHGEHQLGNVFLAIAAATELGMTLENIAEKLQTFHPPLHTFSLRTEGGITILDDTHNASPESLCAAIEWARHQPYTPKMLLTSGIIEQGTATARTHVRCGLLAKDVFDDVYILNKKFAQYFAEGFGKPVEQRATSNEQLPAGSLLVCVGRVPLHTIEKFIPKT